MANGVVQFLIVTCGVFFFVANVTSLPRPSPDGEPEVGTVPPLEEGAECGCMMDEYWETKCIGGDNVTPCKAGLECKVCNCNLQGFGTCERGGEELPEMLNRNDPVVDAVMKVVDVLTKIEKTINNVTYGDDTFNVGLVFNDTF